MVLITYNNNWDVESVVFNVIVVGGPVKRETHVNYNTITISTEDRGWLEIEQPYSFSIYNKEDLTYILDSSSALQKYFKKHKITI